MSNALKNFIGQSVILHGASQYYAADHRGCLKYGFFPVSTLSGENVLKSLLERGFEFRGRFAYAIEQPVEVEVDEMVIRPTVQDF